MLLFDTDHQPIGQEIKFKFYEEEIKDADICMRLSPPVSSMRANIYIEVKVKEIISRDNIRGGMTLKEDDIILQITNPTIRAVGIHRGECYDKLRSLKLLQMNAA